MHRAFPQFRVFRKAAIRRVLLLALLAYSNVARANPPETFEPAAAAIGAATVTLRVSSTAKAGENVPAQVTVLSGVSLGKGLVVTRLIAVSASRIRVTLPGGKQASARLRVLDQFSGLALMQLDTADLPAVALAEETPATGAWVLCASGWGAEEPVVSVGVVAGASRAIRGKNLPPLVQCDLHAAETAEGSGIVDRDGRLLGIVVATHSDDNRHSWTYAAPVTHVQRLMRANSENNEPDALIVLKRRRPVVGMVLDAVEEKVVVARVTENSPAEKAGIEVGDEILAADGVYIRSVYQAVRPLLFKQPGDSMTFLVRQSGELHTVELVLAGGMELPTPKAEESWDRLARRVLNIEGGPGGELRLSDGQTVRELFATPSQPLPLEVEASAEAPDSMQAKLRLLEKAADGYRNAILVQQAELQKRDEELAETRRLIESLNREIQAFKQQMEETPK